MAQLSSHTFMFFEIFHSSQHVVWETNTKTNPVGVQGLLYICSALWSIFIPMLQLREISCLLITNSYHWCCYTICYPVLTELGVVLILFHPSFCPGMYTEMKIVTTQIPAASALDSSVTTTPVQTLAAADGAVHLSTVSCFLENRQKLSC